MSTPGFGINSRYADIDIAQHQTPAGKTVAYLRRRLVPPAEHFALLQEHTVTEGERPDTISAQYLGDPEQFWRLCDANGVMHPDELVATLGRRLRITLPEGIPGVPHA